MTRPWSAATARSSRSPGHDGPHRHDPAAALEHRTFYALGQGHALIDFGPFVAGAAAWMGSRDGRRRIGDLVAVTAVPRWAARLAAWAATALWAEAGYLACVGALYAAIARQATGGGPPWWPVAVGAAGVAAFSALAQLP